MPKVSIIIPTYQHEQFIAKCLSSVIAQSFGDWEAIIVDDGSQDGTAKIINDFVEKDGRFQYFYQENKGIYRLNELYNFALGKAEGELIAVLEGDDYWPEDKLMNQVPVFDKPETVLSWGDGFIDVNGGLFELKGYQGYICQAEKNNFPVGSALQPLMFRGKYFEMPTCSVMYRKYALQKVGGFYQPQGLPWLDRSTWAVLACVGEFNYQAINLGFWRRHPQQVTQNNPDIKTTFDYVFNDPECPVILREKIEPYRSQYGVFSKFVRAHRSRALIDVLVALLSALSSPFQAYQLIQGSRFSWEKK